MKMVLNHSRYKWIQNLRFVEKAIPVLVLIADQGHRQQLTDGQIVNFLRRRTTLIDREQLDNQTEWPTQIDPMVAWRPIYKSPDS